MRVLVCSIEVILLLFAFKCCYPLHFHLNRGNHETVNMNKMYGFEGEVAAKYNKDMMRLFTDIFQVHSQARVRARTHTRTHRYIQHTTTRQQLPSISLVMRALSFSLSPTPSSVSPPFTPLRSRLKR